MARNTSFIDACNCYLIVFSDVFVYRSKRKMQFSSIELGGAQISIMAYMLKYGR
jgi:hypothetical protein